MRIYLLWLCCSFPFLIYAQQSDSSEDSITYQAVLKLSPLSLLNTNPAIQAGVEWKLSRRYYLQTEIGISVPAMFHPENRGFKLRTELRQYLNRKPARKPRRNRALFYKAIELYGSQNRYSEFAQFQFNSSWVEEDITIRRTITGVNLKVGWLKIYRNRLVLDYFLGGGIKFRHIRHLNRQAPGNFVQEDFLNFERKREGSTLLGNVVVGVKLGYLIK